MKKLNLLLIVSSFLVWSCNNSGRNNAAGTDTIINADSTAASVDTDVSDFAGKAAIGGMLEVELGKLAQAQGMNNRVKAFGKMMVDDHTKAGEELRTLAAKKNISVPASLPEDQLKEVADLKGKSGVDFDKSYIKKMLRDHRHDIGEFDKMAKEGSDPEMKEYAAKTLPVLKMHLDSAKAINKEVKASVDPGDITDGIEVYPQR